MTITTLPAERRAGALACFKVATEIFHEKWPLEVTNREYVMRPYFAAERLIKNLPPMSPEAEGAIMALAEFVFGCRENESPSLGADDWMPVVAMTDTQIEERVAYYDACDAEDAAERNVFQFPRAAERRATP